MASPNKSKIVSRFVDAVAEARRLSRPSTAPDLFFHPDPHIALRVEREANADAMNRTLGYAMVALGELQTAGLPNVLSGECERSLRPCDMEDAVWAGLRKDLLAWGNDPPVLAAGKARRKRQGSSLRPVTPAQAEAVQIVGECKGNFAEAARKLGKDRKTVEQNYNAGLRNAGVSAAVMNQKPKKQNLPHDRRGQVMIAADRDD